MSRDIETRMIEMAQQYGRYKANAYRFTFEAVRYTADRYYRRTKEIRHVTGGEVLEGIRQLALRQFGFMAKTVFLEWGVQKTEDFGEIVFQLVREGILSKTDQDSLGDFASGYDFDEVFVRNYDWLDRLGESRSTQA
jgi:uncharacterized repeat protein (TIGR04138 family)